MRVHKLLAQTFFCWNKTAGKNFTLYIIFLALKHLIGVTGLTGSKTQVHWIHCSEIKWVSLKFFKITQIFFINLNFITYAGKTKNKNKKQAISWNIFPWCNKKTTFMLWFCIFKSCVILVSLIWRKKFGNLF